MKKEQHLPDINTENKLFKRLSCNPSVLTLVSGYVTRSNSFFVPKRSPVKRFGFSFIKNNKETGKNK